LAAGSLAALLAIPHAASAYVPMAPILIVGDAGFTPGNGVTGGSGTPGDPYVIEGWEIDASAADGIAILNTTAHFVVRNVRVHSGFWNFVGVWLEDVRNGRIEGSVFADNADGVYVLNSADVTLTSNTITGSLWDGIRVDLSTRISVEGNDAQWNQIDGVSAYETTALAVTNNVVSNNDWGVYLWNVDSAAVAGNNASANNAVGIGFDLSANATATGNQLWANDWGFDVSETSHLVVRRNTVGRSTSDAVAVTGGTNLTFVENTFAGTGGGLMMVGATNARAYHNTFLGNAIQAADNPGANAWDAGYPAGGNHWSDYAGVDNCSGPAQDICPDPDGIGDTPYVIDPDSHDSYPLMLPGGWAQTGPTVATNLTSMLRQPGGPQMARGGPEHPGPSSALPAPEGLAQTAATDSGRFERSATERSSDVSASRDSPLPRR
jgi:parallel beta-helix repeat protein